MTIQWGSYDTAPSPGGTSGMRVGIEVTNTSVSNGSSSVTFTFKVYTQNYLAYTGDSQGLTFGGGGGSGSVSFSNSSATGAVVLRATRTYTYNYPSTSYGSSPGGISFSATSTGAFDGTNASKSIVATVPARPYAAPARPTGVLITRNSDTQATLTWSRAATTGAPYTSQTIQYRYWTGTAWSAWMTAATATSTATSYVRTGMSANNIYQFQIRANNTVGSSIYTASNGIMMTPAAPSNVVSSVSASGTQITTTWTRNHVVPYSPYTTTYTIQRSVNGAAYAALASGITTESYTDASPGAGTNRYKVLAVTTYPPLLSSTYTEGNTVSTIVPPLAPTLLSPNGAVVDLTQPLTFTWQHNPGADGAAQTMFRLQYSANGGGTWQNLVSDVASSAGTYTMPGGTLPNQATPYQWQIRTMGVASAGYGPYSTTATFTGSSAPTTNITAPTTTTASLPLAVTWTYAQAQSSPQAQWWASLFAADGVTVLETKTATGTALSTSFAYPVEDGKTYVIQQQSKSTAGVLSAIDTQITTVTLPVPAPASIAPEYQPCTGTMILALAGATPLPAPADRTNVALNSTWRLASGTVEVRRNYIADPKLVNATSWFGVGAGGAVATGATNTYSPNQTGVAAGEVWAVGIDVTASASRDEVVNLRVGPTTGGTLIAPQGDIQVTVPAGTTQRIVTSGTIPSGGDGVRLWLLWASATPAGVKIGRAALYKAGSEVGYFDGSTPAADGLTYSWTGTANASASTAVGPSFATSPVSAATGTLGVVGWQSDPFGAMRLLLKNDVTTAGLLGFTVHSPQAAAPGDVIAGRIKVRQVDGVVDESISVAISPYNATPAILTPDLAAAVTNVVPADGSWVEFLIPATAAAPASTATWRFLIRSVGTTLAGTQLEFKEAIVQKGVAVGANAGPYFDGSTPDAPTEVYSWTSGVDTSTSFSDGRAEVAAVSAIVERRVDGGDWVTLGQVALPNNLLDTIPLTNGLNEYRVTSVSSAPSYRAGPIVEAYGTDGQVRGNCDQWAFISYGPGFSNILRTHSNLKITSANSRVRASQAFLGRAKPRLAVGQNTSREIGVSATLHWGDFNTVDDDCYYDSPPVDWETMSDEADIVCYRDYTGRRIFGMLSDVSCEEVRWRGWSSVSFSVTEDYYVEAYGEAVS